MEISFSSVGRVVAYNARGRTGYICKISRSNNIISFEMECPHCKYICKQANSTLSFLKRNINISNPKVKENAYKALVRPTMEHACTTWDPYQQNNRHSLES